MDAPTEHEALQPPVPEPPPRGVHVMAIVRWLILLVTVGAAGVAWYGFARAQGLVPAGGSSAQTASVKWQCPMHPQIVQDRPGECPICHMALEKVDPSRTGARAPAPENPPPPRLTVDAARNGQRVFVCPMHPHVQSDKPGECPICHMDLELLLPDGGTTAVPHAGPSASPGPSPSASPSPSTAPPPAVAPKPGAVPPGTSPVQLALDRIQAINVRTTPVEAKEVTRTLRATASVLPTEQGVAEVHVRAPGFVESVSANQTGVAVRAGTPLFSVYSPEIFQAQSELVAASKWTDAAATGNRAAEGARRKLELLGMSPSDIDRVVKKGEPMRAVPVVAPRGGVVTKKNVVLGAYVTPETMLYEIQDLSRVYVVADLFPRDAERAPKGTRGRFVSARGGTPVDAEVDLVYPLADPEARTTRVRFTVKSGELRPGDYGTVEIELPKTRAVLVPRDAIVETGAATYVFVVGTDGIFYPHVVALGGEVGDRVIVTAGVAEGVRVVSGATFLVDSESRLRAAVKAAQ